MLLGYNNMNTCFDNLSGGWVLYSFLQLLNFKPMFPFYPPRPRWPVIDSLINENEDFFKHESLAELS